MSQYLRPGRDYRAGDGVFALQPGIPGPGRSRRRLSMVEPMEPILPLLSPDLQDTTGPGTKHWRSTARPERGSVLVARTRPTA